MRVRRPIDFIAGAAVLGLTAGTTALAATPTAGMWTSPGEGGAAFTVKGSSILPAGQAPRRYIYAPSNFRCNSANMAVKAASIKISGGAFKYDGPAYVDVSRAKKYIGRLVWSGKFTTATTVKGSYRLRSKVTPVPGTPFTFKSKSCDSGVRAWTGTRTQGAGTGTGVGVGVGVG